MLQAKNAFKKTAVFIMAFAFFTAPYLLPAICHAFAHAVVGIEMTHASDHENHRHEDGEHHHDMPLSEIAPAIVTQNSKTFDSNSKNHHFPEVFFVNPTALPNVSRSFSTLAELFAPSYPPVYFYAYPAHAPPL